MEADVFTDADDITRLPEVPAVLSYSEVLIWMIEDSVPIIQKRTHRRTIEYVEIDLT